MIALEEECSQSQKSGLKRGSSPVVATVATTGRSSEIAAKQLKEEGIDIGARSLQRAVRIEKEEPKLSEMVRNGEVSLDQADRCRAASNSLEFEKEEAAKRQKDAGGDRRSSSKKTGSGTGSGSDQGEARDKAAKSFGVSGRTIGAYERVKEKSPELFAMVDANEVTISSAEKALTLPEEELNKLVSEGPVTRRPLSRKRTDGSSQQVESSYP